MSKSSQPISELLGDGHFIRVSDLHVCYGEGEALQGISLEMFQGEIRIVLGPNGAGKTTLLNAIMGLVRPSAGVIEYPAGREIQGLSANEVSKMGVSMVPEGRALFTKMTVVDNLLIGAYAQKNSKQILVNVEKMLDRFPGLARRRSTRAGLLSGGEQQMCAVARALMAEPKLLLMDEPSLGLAPLVIKNVYELIREINNQGINILLVEQNVHFALDVANYGYILEGGKCFLEGTTGELRTNRKIQEVYLGG